MMKLSRLAIHTLWALLSLFFTGILIVALLYVYMQLQLPSVDALKDVSLQVPLRVYTSDGKLIAEYGSKRRIPVKLNQVPKQLIEAVLATEDARFYEHPGVDLIGLVRAAKVVILSGRRVQGASTITMQVARNFFLSSQKTYSRKINEILLALKIDRELPKDKILELYLNKIYFGTRAYGVASAADVYYGKTLDQLTLPEMAMIAGLPQAPSRNNPIENAKAAMERRDHVLKRMLELGYINEKQYEDAIKTPNTAKYHASFNEVKAPYIGEMVRETMVEEYGQGAYDNGLVVYTTVPSALQQDANRAMRNGLMAYDQRHGYRTPTENLGDYNRDVWLTTLQKMPTVDGISPAVVMSVADRSVEILMQNGQTATIPWAGLAWARPELQDGYVGASPQTASEIVKPGDVIRIITQTNGDIRLSQIPQVEGAFVAMNPQNGAILALVGGFNYDRSNFNRAIQAQRQPGSNFKPFVYSAALDKGYTLASIINDAPVVIHDTGINALWRPMNDTQKFYGPTTLRVGLTESRNLVSIRLLQAIGISYAIDYVKRFGFDPNALPHSLSLALGTGLVTPMQIANGYSVFANGGSRVNPFFIEHIEDQHHQVLYQAKPLVACSACITNPTPPTDQIPNPMAPQVITPQNAFLVTQVLKDVIRTGTGKKALVLGRTDLAGKTGTNGETDAWFSGFNSNLEVTVWVGFDNLKILKEMGAAAALPIWIDFMKSALQSAPEATMPQPPGIVMMKINPKTGALAGSSQPNAKFEMFMQDHLPQQNAPTAPSTGASSSSSGVPDNDTPSDSGSDSGGSSTDAQHLF